MPDLSFFRPSVIEWLLEEDNPPVRYFTLRELLEYPEDDPQVLQSKSQILQNGAVPKILDRQKPEGHWGNPEDFYERSKYKGTVWSFILLADLGADGRDERIGRAKEFLLCLSQDSQSGGFAHVTDPSGGGMHLGVIPCLSGNLVWAMLRFGYGDDPRVQRGIDFLATYLRCDDKQSKPPEIWQYTNKYRCWGRHTCMMTVVKTLKALVEIPVEKRSPSVQQAIDNGTEFILCHHLFKRSRDLSKIAKQSWVEFGFPWFWGTDALEMLLILKKLDCRDERMQEAIDLLLSKQDDQGRWINEHSYYGRMLVTIEQEGQPSKWVTLNALRVLKWAKQMNIARH
jgi:hypothetical protein